MHTAKAGNNISSILSEKKRHFFYLCHMYNSKVISLFNTLSLSERRRFKKWVNSPIHNPNDRITAFYTYLDARSEWSERTIKREKVFAAVFENEAYDDLKMRRLMSEFLGILEGFLTYEAWQNTPSEHWLSLAKIYRDRQLSSDATSYLNKAASILNAQSLRDARYYLNQYRLQEERLAQNTARDADLNLQEVADELVHFFVAELLRNACSAASHSAFYRANYQLVYLETVLKDCASGHYDHIPVIRLYYHSYCCLSQPTASEHFFAYKKILPEAAHWLSKIELRDVLLFGINYSIGRSNRDAPGFLRELFDLYKFGLNQEIFLENGILSRFTYKNIVTVGLKLGEEEWVSAFIETHSRQLAPAFQEHYERFCRAKLCYQQQDYGQVQSLLFDVSFDDVLLELNARQLLLKIYFETAEWRLLEGFLTSFERFVARKKMLEYHVSIYRNIIQFTGKLMLWKSKKRVYTPEEVEQLLEQIRTANPLPDREWLLQMAQT